MPKWNEYVRRAGRYAGLIVATLWMVGGTLFYVFRVSTVFYFANKPAIDDLLDRLP